MSEVDDWLMSAKVFSNPPRPLLYTSAGQLLLEIRALRKEMIICSYYDVPHDIRLPPMPHATDIKFAMDHLKMLSAFACHFESSYTFNFV